MGKKLSAMVFLAVCAFVGLVAAALTVIFTQSWLAPLVGWDGVALAYLAGIWAKIGGLDSNATASRASVPDPTRRTADLILLLASAASLVAVGVVVVHAAAETGPAKAWESLLGVLSVVISWFVVHTTYTIRYADLYHDKVEEGGVDFNQSQPPNYLDFAYLAFTIGMTFQVSDTSLTSSRMRANALRHALLSYLYGAVIIAAAINLVAGLVR
jgi:uncharacterized membrane protein